MKTKHRVDATDYLRYVFDPEGLNEAVSRLITCMKKSGLSFSTVAMRGMSGVLVGSPVSMMMDKYPLIVRKDGDDTHSSHKVEGPIGEFDYVIVDDFVSSGRTVTTILEHMRVKKPQAKCVGIFLYWDADCYDPDTGRMVNDFCLYTSEDSPTEESRIPRYTIGRSWAREWEDEDL